MLDTRKDHWEQVFTKKDESAVSWFQENPEPSFGLIKKFNKQLSGPIVDIGAGASRLVDNLLKDGFSDITLLDISDAALGKSKQRLGKLSGNINFIVSDITKWNPPEKYHLWHDRAVFHFLVSQSEQNAYIKALVQATIPGSIVIMGTFALDGPEKCSGLAVQRYSAQSLDKHLGTSFELLKSLNHTHLTPAQREQKFTFALFERV